MLTHRLSSILIVVLFAFSSGIVLAQDGTASTLNRPPLVECVEDETIPCVVNVEEVTQIVGVWRGYIEGATGIGFITYNSDGSYSISPDWGGTPTVTGTLTFSAGAAVITPDDDGIMSPECAAPARYEIRLVQVGEQPVALSYRLAGKDNCVARTLDLSEPALYYVATSIPEVDTTKDVITQVLVPCPEEITDDVDAYACDRFATVQTDLAGIWRIYYYGAMDNGMAFASYNADGNYVNADTPEHTTSAATGLQHGNAAFSFDEGLVTFTGSVMADGEECASFSGRLRVIQFGRQRVAISYTPVEDNCIVRLNDWAYPMIWVSN